MSDDFLSPQNACGQTLLRLTSRGNAIIAELLRLSDFIPPVYRLSKPEEARKYAAIILDFSYFKRSEYYDNVVDSNPELQDLDEEFRENHMEILTRFYRVFESVLKYVQDMQRLLEDLDEGIFIQQTLHSALADDDGKQLLAEVLYLYGVMLLVIDQRISGTLRERMLVSYHRYCTSEADMANLDDVCKLLRSTGYSGAPGAKRPSAYPDDYFARVPIPSHFVTMLISRLRSDDVYNQIAAYPHPDHRSAALANQGAILYVILFFCPDMLTREQAKMREIVDKHFPDNWVLSVYMGVTVDLTEAWEPYKAARTAINNTLEAENIALEAQRHIARVSKLNTAILNLLKQGVLNDDYVLDNVGKLLHVMREANVTIRWLMLHTHREPRLEAHRLSKSVRDSVVAQGYKPRELFELLLNASQFEYVLKEMFKGLLAAKESKWGALKAEASGRMQELSDVFSGATPLTRVEKNEQLQKYFSNMSKQIGALDYGDSTSAGRKIVQLSSALEEVQEFHQLEGSLQIRQFLQETRGSLKQMIRTINIKEEVLINMQIVGDLSYAWIIIDMYTNFMQQGIKSDPGLVIKLRATFLKLASALDMPLVRISQADSPDLASVSQYYSSELVSYVRKVLQIIPQSMFKTLEEIIKLQTSQLKEVPTRLDKSDLKEFAQLDLRYEVARLTYSISVFTEGILMMKSTLMGVIKVDPKQLLEDGIRKELVQQVASALHQLLVFSPKAKHSELLPRLRALAGRMDGFRRSFEYIQDYVNIYGLKIWQEEVSRIVNYNVEQECNSFLRTKTYDWQSVYYNRDIPIPTFAPVDGSVNFIGRLARELLRQTSPATTAYVEQMHAWYEPKAQTEVMQAKLFSQMHAAIGTFGLTGLDRLLSFMVVKELQGFQRNHVRLVATDKSMIALHQELNKAIRPVSGVPASLRVYALGVEKGRKVWQQHLGLVQRVGQIQLLRRLIGQELNFAAKFDAKILHGAVETFNKSVLADTEAHYHDPSKPYPGDQTTLMSDLAAFLECAGLAEPLTKIYVTTKKMAFLSISIFFFVLANLQRLQYTKSVGALTARKQTDNIDGAPFVCGVITLLKQFHSTHTHNFLALIGQYVRAHISFADPKAPALSAEVITMLAFLDEFCRFSQTSRKVAEVYIPSYVFDQYTSHMRSN